MYTTTQEIVNKITAIETAQEVGKLTDNERSALEVERVELMKKYARADHDGFLDFICAETEDEILPYLN